MRWMLYVDGENLTARGQEFAADSSVTLTPDWYWRKNDFLWLPEVLPLMRSLWPTELSPKLDPTGIRARYYTSVRGGSEKVPVTEEALWRIGFEPHVFRRPSDDEQRKSKGVDVSLTTQVLSDAFRGVCDAVIIVTGDGDYVPLVEEVKKQGIIVIVGAFESTGLNPMLRLASDRLVALDDPFEKHWSTYNLQLAKGGYEHKPAR